MRFRRTMRQKTQSSGVRVAEAMRSQSFGQLGAQWAVMSQRPKLCGRESQDIKLPLTMFTLNPNPCLLRLLPTTLFASEFVACFGFSLMITFYAAIYLDGWKMQHVWQDFDCFLKWVLKVVSWIVWVEVVFIQTKQSPKIGDKAPPLSFVPRPPSNHRGVNPYKGSPASSWSTLSTFVSHIFFPWVSTSLYICAHLVC